MKSDNLASTEIIHDGLLRVSTAIFYDYHLIDGNYPEPSDRIETIIFSKIPGIRFNIVFHNSEKEALRVHKAIVKSLKKKLGIK